MKTEDIIAKYPKIFVDYEGNPGRCNWYGVPYGWLSIVDDLCGAIQNYIDYRVILIDNPEYVEGSTYDEDDSTTWKFSRTSPNQVTCTQMKEKFGGLRFYENDGDKQVDGMISMAEYLCSNTCQDCGSREDVGVTTSGWISVICKSCATEGGDKVVKKWKSKEQSKIEK
jgi:hypothetical protein